MYVLFPPLFERIQRPNVAVPQTGTGIVVLVTAPQDPGQQVAVAAV